MSYLALSVPRTGLEPARLAALAPETSASTIPPPGLLRCKVTHTCWIMQVSADFLIIFLWVETSCKKRRFLQLRTFARLMCGSTRIPVCRQTLSVFVHNWFGLRRHTRVHSANKLLYRLCLVVVKEQIVTFIELVAAGEGCCKTALAVLTREPHRVEAPALRGTLR